MSPSSKESHINNDFAYHFGDFNGALADSSSFPALTREAVIRSDFASCSRMASVRSGLTLEGSDGALIDSLVVALLEDIARDKHARTKRDIMVRASPLAQEHLYGNVSVDEPDPHDIASDTTPPASLASAELPPVKNHLAAGGIQARGTIVIAEDDEVTRLLLCRVLTRAGFNVHACENGQLACDAVRANRADLVLLDWMMPIMDGPAAVVQLKANADTRGIPVMMLSSRSEIEERVIAFESGVQDFLTKPCDPRELIARIEQQMRWREMLGIEANAV